MMTTLAEFPQLLQENTIPKSFSLRDLQETVTKIEAIDLSQLGQGSLELRWREKNEAIEKAVVEYVISSIGVMAKVMIF